MPKKSWLCVLGMALALTAHAEELLFAGQVQQLTFKPSGLNDCPPPCGWPKPAAANGMQAVCISNQGACQIADVNVVKDYLSNGNVPSHTIRARTGEWGGFVLPVRVETILIHYKDGNVRWAPIVERDGKLLVEPKKLALIRPSDAAMYQHDRDALVPVEDAIEQIRRAGAH